jgi:hypothetical protein
MNRYLSSACTRKGCIQRLTTLAALGVVLLTVACAGTPANQQAAAPAAAADAATAANTTVAAADTSQERECRSVKVTGTNFPKRVCESKAYWNAKARAERRISDEFGRQTNENSAIVQPGTTQPGFVPTTP